MAPSHERLHSGAVRTTLTSNQSKHKPEGRR